jgi:hypothetical protein
MYSQLKAGAALILLASGGTAAFAENGAKDLMVSAYNKTKIVTVKTTPERVAFTQDQSGNRMSPMPSTGNVAMLITGVCLVGVAASRRKVAA